MLHIQLDNDTYCLTCHECTTQIYTIHREYERERGYIDLLLTRRPPIMPNYQFAFELKYRKQASAHQLQTVQTAARQQLRAYRGHADLQALADLRGWVVIFVRTAAKVVELVEAEAVVT